MNMKIAPVAGAEVLYVTNNKGIFGSMSLAEANDISKRLYQQLRDSGGIPAPVGGNLLGRDYPIPHLPVTEEYLDKRVLSAVFDVFYGGEPQAVRAVARSLGFTEISAGSHFSITFRNPDGTEGTMLSLPGQALYVGSPLNRRVVLNAIPVPTTFYQSRSGALSTWNVNELPTPEQTVAYKLLRVMPKDVADITAVATATPLSPLMDGVAIATFENGVKEASNTKWIKGVKKGIIRIINGLRDQRYGKQSPVENEKVLENLVDTVNDRLAVIQKPA